MQPLDLIENESFRRWIYRPTEADTGYWEAWMAEHPDNRANAALARQFLLSAKGEPPTLTDQTVATNVRRMLTAIEETEPEGRYALNKPWWSRQWTLTGVAASVLLALVSGFWFLKKSGRFSPEEGQLVQQQAALRMIEVVNNQAVSRLVRLSDGSLVRLHAQAKIRFPERFEAQSREVQLSGTAFFEVTKDPSKPFLVHANSLITRVVGTSFTIYAPEQGTDTRVVVRTGRVAVYPSTASATPSNPDASAVMLVANQQAVYHPGDARPAKEEVAKPERVTINRFSFRRTPLARVFQSLEQTYGIRVLYDARSVANCTLTVQFDDQSLFEKLDVITASTGTSYELTDDGMIQIRPGSGCQ